MKRQRLIILASIILIVFVGFVYWNAGSSSHPVLVFKGYERSGTNAAQSAKLELRNTTRTPIWLLLEGEKFPLSPGFLERPMVIPPKTTNGVETIFRNLRIGSFFMNGKKLLPGDSLGLEFPLVSGKPPEQGGLTCYVGDFKDGNDFINNVMIVLLDDRATLKERIKFFWEKIKRSLKAPRHFEVWCPQPLSFQSEKSPPTDIPAQ
jgi:hypothetical protein